MTKKELYDYRKENHLCTTCGSPIDDDRTTCKACRQKRKAKNAERYKLYTKNGICPDCGKKPAENGSVLCADCRDRKRKSYFENSWKYNKRHLKKEKSKRRKLIKKGLCPKCGRPTGTERVYCDKCLEYLREQNRQSRARNGAKHVGIPKAEWSQYGWCNRCGVAVNDGANLCPTCKGILSKQVIHMRARLSDRHEEWRAKGLCGTCGKHRALDGFKVCQGCKDKLDAMRIKSVEKCRKKVVQNGCIE